MATTADKFQNSVAADDSFTAPGAVADAPEKRKSLLPLIAAVAAAVIAATGGGLYLAYRHSLQTVSPLEPNPNVGALTVPIEPSTASAPIPAALAAAPENGLASAAVAVASGASNAVDAVAESFATLRSSISALTGRVDTLEQSDQKQNIEIAALRTDVDKVVGEQATVADKAASAATAAVAARMSAAPRRVAAAPRRSAPEPKKVAVRAAAAPTVAAAPAPAPRTSSGDASLLAVDTWGGKPSVAVARSGAGGGFDVRFLSEGETQGSVTLKRADVGSQRATFTTPGGDLTLAPKEQ